MKQTFFVGVVLLAGCAFKVAGNGKVTGERDMARADVDMSVLGGGDVDMAGASSSTDMAHLPGADLMTPLDLGPVCIANSKQCSPTGAVETCRGDATGFDSTPCAYGCGGTGAGTHCKVFTPTPPVTSDDYGYTGVMPKTFGAGNWVFDTSTGAITKPDGTSFRLGSDPATRNVVSGIGFHRASNIAIWSFASLTIGANANIGFANAFGVAFVSQGAISVDASAVIDVRGYKGGFTTSAASNGNNLCADQTAGPGGGNGGIGITPAAGTGAGARSASMNDGGGIGGSFGSVGALGGNAAGSDTVTMVYGPQSLSPLVGGSGGGASSGPLQGGGGGGIFELFSVSTISLAGTINAGGCGAPNSGHFSGGGGGSGGGILLEAQTVTLAGTAKVSANGGGGGGGGENGNTGSPDGQPGQAGSLPATGGAKGGSSGAGGNGAAGTIAATKGGDGTTGGGGGGGVGRIRINTQSGSATGSDTQLSPPTSTTAASVDKITLQ